jgi:outer membrane receptor protein involved in Fe transport
MSISAIGGDKLKQAGVSNVADLTKIVPGFSFQPSDYGSPILTLRGVGLRNVAIAVSPTVSVYLDQVPLPFSEMTRGASLDLERVEVLKGPQGTLFGQNSTGGAINYIAAKPTHDVQGGASLTYGRFNEVDGDVTLSGPLSDTVRARVAVRTEQRDGWQKSLTRDDSLGSRNFTTGRLLLDWDPSASLSLSLNVNGWLDKSETPASQFLEYAPQIPDGRQTLVPYLSSLARAPDKARWADWDPGVDFHRNDHMIQTALRADWTIAPETTITSITAYASFRQRSPIDNDGTAVNDLRLSIHGDIDSVSQELRVSGTAFGGGLKWVVGGNYESDITRDEQSGRFMGTNATGAGVDFDEFSNINHSNIKSYAAFASLDYAITPQLLLQGSARYTRSIIDFRGCLADDGTGSLATSFSLISGTTIAPGACVTLDPVTFKPVPIVTNALKEDNAPWRAGISYRPTPGSNYYFNVTRGYKAGSFPTVPGFFPAQFAPVKQESVLAYEMGFKQSFLQGKLRVSGAAFYYDYSDKQILGYILTAFGNMPALISIPRSDIKGAEIQIDARPIRGWTVSAGASYIKSRVRSNFIGNDPLANPVNFKGEEFPGSPKWQASVDTQYDFALTSDLKAFLGGTLAYRSATQAAFGNLAISRLNGYALLDLRAGLEAGKWRLQVYGHNITNKFYVNNIGRSEDTFSRTVGMPVTYGVTVSRKF